eukprot:8627845-Ditylum_brightwellii.AAC.1
MEKRGRRDGCVIMLVKRKRRRHFRQKKKKNMREEEGSLEIRQRQFRENTNTVGCCEEGKI